MCSDIHSWPPSIRRMSAASTAVAAIEDRILTLRGQKVLLDSDLATLYGVSTKTLLQAVRRNHTRFPSDFMFKLTIQ